MLFMVSDCVAILVEITIVDAALGVPVVRAKTMSVKPDTVAGE